MSQVKEQFGAAVIQALIVCVVRFFTIPWRIWKGAVLRLAAQRHLNELDTDIEARTEFPVLSWFRMAWDGVILLSWPITFVVAFLGMLGGIFTGYATTAMGGFIVTLITAYFSVIFLSLAKESLMLILTIATNIETINSKLPISTPKPVAKTDELG